MKFKLRNLQFRRNDKPQKNQMSICNDNIIFISI